MYTRYHRSLVLELERVCVTLPTWMDSISMTHTCAQNIHYSFHLKSFQMDEEVMQLQMVATSGNFWAYRLVVFSTLSKGMFSIIYHSERANNGSSYLVSMIALPLLATDS